MQASLPVFALWFQSGRAIIPNQIDMQVETPGGQMRASSVRPFDEGDPVLRFIPSELEHLIRVFNSVEIEMEDGEAWPVIGLNQSVGRARHFCLLAEKR